MESGGIKTRLGYTTIELVIVAGIAAVAMAAIVPVAAKLERDSGPDRGARQVSAELRKARMRAIARQELTTVTVFPGQAHFVIAPSGQVKHLPPGSKFVADDEDDDDPIAVQFDTRGLLTSANTVSFGIDGHGHGQMMEVSPIGYVEMEDHGDFDSPGPPAQ